MIIISEVKLETFNEFNKKKELLIVYFTFYGFLMLKENNILN